MKFLIQFILTIIIALLLQLFLPFWSVAIAAFLVAFTLNSNGLTSFSAGLLSILLLWLTATLLVNNQNENILFERVATIFDLKSSILILIMCLLGGLLGGLAAATGSHLRGLLFNRNRGNNPYRM